MWFRRRRKPVNYDLDLSMWESLFDDGDGVHVSVVTRDQQTFEGIGEELRTLPWVCGLRWYRSVEHLSMSRLWATRRVILADPRLEPQERNQLERYTAKAAYDGLTYLSLG